MNLLKFRFCVIALLFSEGATKSSEVEAKEDGVDDNPEHRVYILFLGLSGSGKSSTINVLFNSSIAPEGDTESTTKEIHEYSLKIPNYPGELRIIDTPGMEDTGGLENDAQFLATLEEYLKSDEVLSYRRPDVLVICSRFDDNRFLGDGSKFVKMLRGISVLQDKIITQNNTIFLLTHFMGGNAQELRNPSAKKEAIEKTIREYTLFPSPFNIVIAENKGDDQELERVDLGHQLPNGEIYPYNLCESVKQILRSSSKEMFWSDACFRNASVSKNIKLVSQVALLPKESPGSLKMMEFLLTANFKTEETEISVKLREAFNNLPNKDKFPADTLIYFQKAFHYRFITSSDIPKTDVEIASLFKNIGRVNDAAAILKEAFGLQVPNLPFDSLVGNSYDISQDSPLVTSLFNVNKNLKPNINDLGYAVPVGIIPSLDIHQKIFYKTFSSENEYLRHRAFLLGIENDADLMNNYVGDLKPGFNLISSGSCPSIYIEFRTIKFELGKVDFSEQFISKLTALPDFNVTLPKVVQNWERFFQIYGAHVITDSYGGGSIEFLFEDYPCNSLDLKEIIESVINSGNGNQTVFQSIKNRKLLKISGGDRKFYSENPRIFFDGGKKSFFNSWKDSLVTRPTVLPNYIRIKSTMGMLRNSNRTPLADKMEKGVNFFFKDQTEDILSFDIQRLEKEKSELLNRLESLNNEKASCISEKSVLNGEMEKIQREKTQTEVKTVEMLQELSKTKELLSQTKINLETEKSNSKILEGDIRGCKSTADGIRSQLETERNHIQNLKQIAATTQSKVSALQSTEISLRGQLNFCNGRQCNEWFHSKTTLCYDWYADGNGGQCSASAHRLCAPVNQMTQYYRDDTDKRGGGCQMRWGIMSPNAPSWAVAGIQLCYRWYPDGNRGQCHYGQHSGQFCAPIGQFTSFYRDDTDRRGGGCQMSWMLQVPQDSPAWLLRASLCFNWYADGNSGQCNNGHGNSFCAQANTWTTYYRDDTDRRGGGCQMSWGIKY